ncbi:hypothetical protein [Streptomyces sp. NPDC058861]|uniref:hypothetical protein n=1 Tax=Streptomyces sp. NPDC058861 TaxID=3346653 RepID=UPI00368C73E4
MLESPRVWKAAVVVCLAGMAVSCTEKTEPKPTASASESSPWPSGADCGLDATAQDEGLLSIQDVWSDAGKKTRSTRIVNLDRTTCATGQRSATAPANSCETSGFPWTNSPASSNQDLYSSGIRRWAYASLEGPDGTVLKEHVLIPEDGKSSGIVDAYRKHLETCKAQVIISQNGKPVQFLLEGSPGLVVSLQSERVTALQGYGSGWKSDQLVNLLGTAENRSRNLAKN